MGKITGGEVEYGQTVKTGDYENKKVSVKLTFAVEDGEDYNEVLNSVAHEAHAKAKQMLGAKAAAPVTPKPAATPKPAMKPTKEASAAAMNAREAEGEDMSEFNEDADEAQPEIPDDAMSSAMNRTVARLKAVHGQAAPKLIK